MSDFPSGSDMKAARLLGGFTVKSMLSLSGIAGPTLEIVETSPDLVREATFVAVMRVLRARGIKFRGPGLVELDGALAPTVEAVGAIAGERLKRARFAVRLDVMALAVASGVSTSQIRRLEKLDDCRVSVDQLHLFAIMSALHRAGYRFGASALRDGLVHPRCKRCVQLHPVEERCA